MTRTGIDMWLIISREYNEDPVLKTMLPATWMGARRTTMLLMYQPQPNAPVEALAVARYNVGELFKKAWEPEQQPDQWAQLRELIAARNPKKIGINFSDSYGHADGLVSTHHRMLKEKLGDKWAKRLISAEPLAVGWLETRTAAEMAAYRHVMQVAHHIVREGLSENVIVPGVTSTDEVVWWYRQRITELGLQPWFHPSVDVQRAAGASDTERSFASRPNASIIQPGDLVHVDFGITYLGLNTDTQHNAYVLRLGETEPPAYLKAAFEKGKQQMDILTQQFATGKSGNQLLAAALAEGQRQGLKPQIYTHPIGYHGHAAGPAIGMWDKQGGVPGSGDYIMYPNTAYSIELNVKVQLTEWQREIRMMMEEDAFFDGQQVYYIGGRQQRLYTIPETPVGVER